MNGGDYEIFYYKTYIWQLPDWPRWRYDHHAVMAALLQLSAKQGHIAGRLHDLGFDVQVGASVEAMSKEALQSSQIEGETLNVASVRSSVARRLGVDIGALTPADRKTEGVVEMVLDATRNHQAPLTAERLFHWHRGLFPDNSGILSAPIRLGDWRDDALGPMQVVSGPLHKQKVHYQAPPAATLASQMQQFLDWANTPGPEPMIIKAALAHLWLVTIHPFDDGNGRIARAVGDLFLSRAERDGQRFYSLSAQLAQERNDYYDMLERTQSGSLEVSSWLIWLIGVLGRAIDAAEASLSQTIKRTHLTRQWAGLELNARQQKVLGKLVEGFEGHLTSGKWAAINQCSTDTALRDVNELVTWGILEKAASGGRSTHYRLK